MSPNLDSLIFGAAALGQAYGITNPAGGPSAAEAESLLDTVWQNGIRRIDTAALYGESEARIGAWIEARQVAPAVVTKLPPLQDVAASEIGDTIIRLTRESLSRLRQPEVDACLLHRGHDWARPEVRDALYEVRAQGLSRKIGLSVYAAEEALELYALAPFDTVQTPLSLFDRGAETSGLAAFAAEAGLELAARSLFLQGMLFADPDTLQSRFRPVAPVLRDLRHLADSRQTSLQALALHAVLMCGRHISAVVGFYRPGQVSQTIDAASKDLDPEIVKEAIDIASRLPGDLANPVTWQTGGAGD